MTVSCRSSLRMVGLICGHLSSKDSCWLLSFSMLDCCSALAVNARRRRTLGHVHSQSVFPEPDIKELFQAGFEPVTPNFTFSSGSNFCHHFFSLQRFLTFGCSSSGQSKKLRPAARWNETFLTKRDQNIWGNYIHNIKWGTHEGLFHLEVDLFNFFWSLLRS